MKLLGLTLTTLLLAATASAANIDMKDPRRAVGREDDIKVDAQLVRDTISRSAPVSVTYQVENLTREWIAIADRVAETTYDAESRTITLSIGAEIPAAGAMPHLVTIAPGEKKTFTAGAMTRVVMPATRTPFTAFPRQVQIRVNVLRDIRPFRELIERQSATVPSPALTDAQFETWLSANESIFLNALPVRWDNQAAAAMADAEQSLSARRRDTW